MKLQLWQGRGKVGRERGVGGGGVVGGEGVVGGGGIVWGGGVDILHCVIIVRGT